MELIQKGNTKLAEAGILMFNLPASKEVCGRECAGCYAIKEQKRWPSVIAARNKRLEASKEADFEQRITKELAKRINQPKYFRVHSSGDFYSQDYVDVWVRLAQAHPHITFYAYTKRFKKFDFAQLTAQNNFVLINSMMHGVLNYGPVEAAPKGVFVCPDQPKSETVCGVTCNYCMTKTAQKSAPYFRKH